GLESTRLGPSDRQDTAWDSAGRWKPPPRNRELRPPVDDEHLYHIVDALDEIAAEIGKSVPQIALNWLLQRPTVSSVIIGARNEEQLRQNLGAVGWSLTSEQVAKLDEASAVTAPYPHFPYRRQEGFARLNPPMV